MFLLVPVDASGHSAEPTSYESSHGPAPTCDGGNASAYQSAGISAIAGGSGTMGALIGGGLGAVAGGIYGHEKEHR